MASGIHDSEGEDRPLAEINVTPMVDVMLVLLIIFIILAPAMANSLRVTLPKAAGESAITTDPLTVTLRPDGSTLIGEQIFQTEALARHFQDASQRNPDLILRIDGDKETPYEKVAQLLSLAQNNGIQKISFTTRTP
ncbi:MAG: biopolymer transporter ExbD [Magnetococcus sp. DMHC-6]